MDTGAKIMVVDDDPDMREALQMMLEAAGHTVVTILAPRSWWWMMIRI